MVLLYWTDCNGVVIVDRL